MTSTTASPSPFSFSGTSKPEQDSITPPRTGTTTAKVLYQVPEEETGELEENETKSRQDRSESIVSTSSAFTNLTWRISSTQGEFFDEQFSSNSSDLLNTGGGPLLLSNQTTPTSIAQAFPKSLQREDSQFQRIQRLQEQLEDNSLDSSQNSTSTITQSTSFKSNPNSTTMMNTTADTSFTGGADMMTSFPSPPSLVKNDSPLIPFLPESKQQLRSPSQTSHNSDSKQKRLAELRARQHALFLEEKRLEAERSPDVSHENDFVSFPQSSPPSIPKPRQSPPSGITAEDTEMHEGSPSNNQSFGRASLNRRQIPLPPQPPPPSSVAPTISPLRVNRSNRSSSQENHDDNSGGESEGMRHHNRSTEEIASDFEMASLRAQVAQLQLALKKQMNPTVIQSNKIRMNQTTKAENIHQHQPRLDPMNLLELTTTNRTVLPPTPAESQAGSSEPGVSRRPTTNRGMSHNIANGMIEEQYGRAYNDHIYDHQSSLSSPNSTFSHHHQYHHNQNAAPISTSHHYHANGYGSMTRFSSGSSQALSRPSNTFSRTSDTFGNTFTSAGSMVSGNSGHKSSRGPGDSSFGQRSILGDESASLLSRPSEDRVDELSAKIDRLEELLRLTALKSTATVGQSTRMSFEETPSTTTANSGSTVHLNSGNQLYNEYQHHHHQLQEHRPMQQNAMIESEVLPYQRMQLHPQSQNRGPIRTPSLASSNSSQGGLSSGRTKSPASSAFQFNATPYARYVGDQGNGSGDHPPMNGQHRKRNSSLPDQFDLQNRMMMHQQQNPHQQMMIGSSNDLFYENQGNGKTAKISSSGSGGSDKIVEHIPRKGVARFILGNSTTKLIDKNGEEVPSTQLSLSFNRTERIEKLPKVKIKSAGRGRIVVKQATTKK